MPDKRFNLIDVPWIPVVDVGRVSLREVFSNTELKALGGNPVQKIALTKLLLAIAQSACTPQDDEEWKQLGSQGLATVCLDYLDKWHDRFYLYGEKPFLQMPAIQAATVQSFGAVLPEVATGNTTVHTQIQQEKTLDNADKALLVLQLMGFGLGGKKTDNSIVLSPGYTGKSNDKGKASTGKPSSAIGFMGFLHNFWQGQSLQETIWLNLLTQTQVGQLKVFTTGLGVAPWEEMPTGEADAVAKRLSQSLIGRLIPMSRFVLLSDSGLHYSEGIKHPGYKEGVSDPSVSVNYSGKESKAIWVDTEKRPWRMLTALLSFLSAQSKVAFTCHQLEFGLQRAASNAIQLGLWSGGLRVSSNAGEQYVSGTDDFLESLIFLPIESIGEIWFEQLNSEMLELDTLSKTLYVCVLSYFKHQTVEGKNQAAQATNLFWQLCESRFQNLINRCGKGMDEERHQLRKVFAGFVHQAFNQYCSKETARQLDAWAQSRPNLCKYLGQHQQPKQVKENEQVTLIYECVMSERNQSFVDYVIRLITDNKGIAAALRRADNPNTEYQSWEVLAGFGVQLDNENQRLPFATVAADIARVKPLVNGSVTIGQAIARSYDDGNQSDQAKAKLRRLLACDTTSEVCRILRPLLSLIASKGGISLDYIALLNDLLWFSHDDSRQRIKARWAQQFYGKQIEDNADE